MNEKVSMEIREIEEQHARQQSIAAAERRLIEAADYWERFESHDSGMSAVLAQRVREWREAKGEG